MTMPLRIGIIAPPWLPVPPPLHSEAETAVDQLARGLTEAGYQVTLFTTGDAKCPVDVRSYFPTALGTGRADRRAELVHVEHAYRELAQMDVIHDHTLAGLQRAGWRSGHGPVITTIHGKVTPERHQLYSEASRHVAVVASSWAQRRDVPDTPVTAVVHYGVDTADYPSGLGDGRYVMFSGRLTWQSGAHLAIAAARRAGKRIVVAGGMADVADRRYFAERVMPGLGRDVVYVGDIGGDRRNALLAGAEALIYPSRDTDPGGLSMIEALACGTPVVALRDGVALEIVESGRTGFLCVDRSEFTNRLHRIGEINRALCRASVEVRFSADRMVATYLALYRRVTGVKHVPRRRAARRLRSIA
ncbi:glycosyltransferase [Phytoactinopolyspora halotolerans]|uniref:Glycosyltransferase family 4 protein n=1 Tax=Phytoactinopolyspora halotolerans TaxID=1981512 RepID=A0A6L9S6X6_9ACTN|nr:glycosyltransferase [Phytoactinopolyspora halotolerans]NEE00916.1 glycosyltransferase family 4 protein [Phytoactinopolyspora halotolerans]